MVGRAQLGKTVADGGGGAGAPGSLSHLRTPGPPCFPGPRLSVLSLAGQGAQPVHPGPKTPSGALMLWSPDPYPGPGWTRP